MNYGYQPQQMGGFQPYQQAPQMPQFSPQFPMDRLQQLQAEAAYRDAQTQMQASQQVPQQQNIGIKVVPVSSIDEAKAFLSPTDGSRVYFINSSNEEIYSKQLDFNTGKSIFLTYKLSFEQPEDKKEPIDYKKDFIGRDEFNSIKTEYETLKKEMNKLKKMLRDKLETEEEE